MTTTPDLRVAYVSADPDLDVFGRAAASVGVQETLRALVRRGAAVTLFAANAGGPLAVDDVTLVGLPRSNGGGSGAERAALAANDVLATQLRRHGPFDLVYERCSLFSWIAMNAAAGMGAAAVLEIDRVLLRGDDGAVAERAAAQWALNQAVNDADAVVTQSDLVASWLSNRGAPAARVTVLPRAVDVGRFDLPRVHTASRFTVGFVGSLERGSGADVVTDAFLRVSSGDLAWHLLVVGDGSARDALQRRLHAGGRAQQATFTGAVAAAEVPLLLARVDVGVVPGTVAARAVPLTALEHLAAGVPLIASRLPQTAQVLRDGTDALLVPAGDAAALADALQQLRTDQTLCARLSAAGRESARHRHSWDRAITTVLTQIGLDIAHDVPV